MISLLNLLIRKGDASTASIMISMCVDAISQILLVATLISDYAR